MPKKKQHPSQYIERMLFSAFVALFVMSILLLLSDIDVFTGWASLHTAQVADGCERTLPPSLPCSQSTYGFCPDSFEKELVVTRKGDPLCCCLPPPEIKLRSS